MNRLILSTSLLLAFLISCSSDSSKSIEESSTLRLGETVQKEIVQKSISEQKTAYQSLSIEERYSVWMYKISLLEIKGLSTKQAPVIKKIKLFISNNKNNLFKKSKIGIESKYLNELNTLLSEALPLFGKRTILFTFTVIENIEQEALYRSKIEADQKSFSSLKSIGGPCRCSEGAIGAKCSMMDHCDCVQGAHGCSTTSDGCGWFWAYSCVGVCSGKGCAGLEGLG